MINHRKNKKKLPYILLLISLLIILIYFGVSFPLFKQLKIFFHNYGTNLENIFLFRKEDFNKNIELVINKGLEDENNKLKEFLSLKETNYNIVYASVIDRDDWYKYLTINKGSKDNIKKDMVVIDNNGLIGKIIEVGKDYSIVSLITGNLLNNRTSVSISDNNYYGVLSGYDINNRTLIVDTVSKNSDIKVGDLVYTNGLGGIIPEGIYIGSVIDIGYDELELSKVLSIKTNINYDNIRYVGVISR